MKPAKDKSACCPLAEGLSCRISAALINPTSLETAVLIICKGAIDVNVLFLILDPVTTISSTSSSETFKEDSDESSTTSSVKTTSSLSVSMLSSATSTSLSATTKNGIAKNKANNK